MCIMKKLLFTVSVLLGAMLCLILQREYALAEKTESRAEISDHTEGWWLLHEYHDRVMNNRKIGAFSFEEPVWDAIVIHVTADSVYSAGTIYPMKTTSRRNGDTIRIGGMNSSDIFFIYKKKKKELTVEFTNSDSVKEVFHYRRFRSNEYVSLTKNLFDRNHFWALKTNYHAFMVDYLFAGTYTSAEDKSTMDLGADESVTGFGQWKRYRFDDFFGTMHWNGKLDRIRFEDPAKTGVFKDYNWRISGDTLILQQFIGKDIEAYKIGGKELKYIRNPRNPSSVQSAK